MHQGRRRWIAPLVLLIFLLGGISLADSGLDELECVPGEPYQVSLEGEEPSTVGAKGVPRNRVLLETFGRTT